MRKVKIEKIKKLEKEINYLLNKNLLTKQNFSHFFNFRKELKLFSHQEFRGSKIENYLKSIESSNRDKRGLIMLIDFCRGDISKLKQGGYFKKKGDLFFKNQLNDLAGDYLKWVKKAKSKILSRNIKEISDLQTAEYILGLDNKIIIRRGVGNMIAIILSSHLVKLLRRENIRSWKGRNYDLLHLSRYLRNNTKNEKLKRFLNKKDSSFQKANNTRQGSTHIEEKAPSRDEIKLSIELTKELISGF